MRPTGDKVDLPRVAVFLHSGEYDRVHEGLSIAASAIASQRRADVFLFWWALERFARDELDDPDFDPAREDLIDRFETHRLPTLRSLLTYLRESEQCTLYACTGSMQILGIPREALERTVHQFVGWSTILQLTAGVTDRFWL
jgi:peroxiredoxin family protein